MSAASTVEPLIAAARRSAAGWCRRDERAECSAISGTCAGDEFRVRWFCSFSGHGRRVASSDTSGVREVPHATIGTLCVGS